MKIQKNITENQTQNITSFDNRNYKVNSEKTNFFEQILQQNEHLLTVSTTLTTNSDLNKIEESSSDRTENESALSASMNYPVVPYQSNSKMFIPITNATMDPSLKRIEEFSSEEQAPTPTIFCSIANVCKFSLDFFCLSNNPR